MQFDARIPYEELAGKEVVVGLSGGVDSSLSAALLKENGMHVTALFMKNWEEDDNESYCAAAKDREDAQKVCDKLGIELKTINFASEYGTMSLRSSYLNMPPVEPPILTFSAIARSNLKPLWIMPSRF